MSDGILSQEEIDALLNGGNNSQPATDPAISADFKLSDFEKDALGEIGNISMGTSATTLSTLLRRKVSITTPDVSVTTRQKLQSDYPLPYVVIEVKYTQGLSGTNVLIMKEQDACVIANLMMGGDGSSGDLSMDDITLSAVGEAMNQMMGSATTSLSSMFNQRIDIAPPELTLVDLGKNELNFSTGFDSLVQIKFKMVIEDLVNSEIMQIIPQEAVRSMIDSLMGNTAEETTLETFTEPEQTHSVQPAPQPAAPSRPPEPVAAEPVQPQWDQSRYNDIPSNIQKGEKYTVQPVQFAALSGGGPTNMPQNIGLIMDVPLDVSVELGKTQKTIKEILELNQGSIIQLDKMAGEPVDLLVNGKLVAKGEVVVIDENYGIRITAIISPMDRMNKLQ
ncbi:MAG TPA: flagellar motor switch phosphatase FliY [Syntrophomonadaceae bacterium]|nr:flagellar motor switch phosphatase FliY [Syntrophomonadaceae bacterium]